MDALFAFERDPESRTMAMVKPRSREAFQAIWDKYFRDRSSGVSGAVSRAILSDGAMCGSIGIIPRDRVLMVGYSIARPFWGKGIASRALALLLAEAPQRPLHAYAAASNVASLRVLEKNGFKVVESKWSPETERYLACNEVHLVLER